MNRETWMATAEHRLMSTDEQDQQLAIELWCEHPSSDSARELIRLYSECGWRETRIQILRALGSIPVSRSVEFLISHIERGLSEVRSVTDKNHSKPDSSMQKSGEAHAAASTSSVAHPVLDYPLLESAIWALGQTQHPLANRFLTHLYPHCPEPLAHAVVGALSHFPSLATCAQMLSDLPKALSKNHWILARNLVLALGEMRATEVLPQLESLIRKPVEPHLTWAALIAFGKINRHPDRLTNLETALQSRLESQPIDRHFISLIRSQVNFRSRWGIQEYLARWFEDTPESSQPHRCLPIELNQFTASEVHAGLQLYRGPDPEMTDLLARKMAQAITLLQFNEVPAWLAEFFKTPREIERALESMVAQAHPGFLELLISWKELCLREPQSPLALAYLHALSLSCGIDPKVETLWQSILCSPSYAKLSHDYRLHWIQAWADYAIGATGDPKAAERAQQLTEKFAALATTDELRARWVRLLASLKRPSQWVINQAPQWLSPQSGERNRELVQSLALYLEAHRVKKAAEWISEVLEREFSEPSLDADGLAVWIRALAFLGGGGAASQFQIPHDLAGRLRGSLENHLSLLSRFSYSPAIKPDSLNRIAGGTSLRPHPLTGSHSEQSPRLLQLARSLLYCLSQLDPASPLLPLPQVAHPLLIGILASPDARPLHLLCIIAAKNYSSPEMSEAIAPYLTQNSLALKGRAIDSLCHHFRAFQAKGSELASLQRVQRLLLDCLENDLERPETLSFQDRILRQFDREVSQHETPAAWIQKVEKWIERYPDHPFSDRWSNLVSEWKINSLREANKSGRPSTPKSALNVKLDQHLATKVKGYAGLPEAVKAAVRSAELPLIHPELFNDHVDKSSSILEYSKAIDTAFEKIYGEPILFPKLENDLATFQNRLYAIGLNDATPSPDRILEALELADQFTPSQLQLHKMGLLAQSVLNGRILVDGFKAIDGLRAWAILLLWFSRPLPKIGYPKALLPPSHGASASAIAQLARKLIALQEARNPAAHRQIFLETKTIEGVRTQFYELMSGIIYYFQER